jgi:hypothetical protein
MLSARPLIGPHHLPRGLGCGGDFSEQLVGEPIAEGGKIADHQHESAGPQRLAPLFYLEQSLVRPIGVETGSHALESFLLAATAA